MTTVNELKLRPRLYVYTRKFIRLSVETGDLYLATLRPAIGLHALC